MQIELMHNPITQLSYYPCTSKCATCTTEWHFMQEYSSIEFLQAFLENHGHPEAWGIDCGAHMGIFGVHLDRWSNKTYSFEVGDNGIDALKINCDIFKSIVPIKKGVSYKDGRMYYEKNRVSAINSGDGIPVDTIKLDSYFSEHDLSSLRFIKMDIEGGEVVALEGAEKILSTVETCALMVECCPKHLACYGNTSENLMDKIESFGFRLVNCTRDSVTKLLHPQNLKNLHYVKIGK